MMLFKKPTPPAPMPDYLKGSHERWVFEYKNERHGKETAQAEARRRNIPEKRIRAVLWYPIAGFTHEPQCECKASIWLHDICLGCGKPKPKEVDNG